MTGGDRLEPSLVELTTPIGLVKGVSQSTADGLTDMGLFNVGRLIAHIPSRYEQEQAEAPIDQLEPGQLVSVRGEITAVRPTGFGKRQRLSAVLHDGTGRVEIVWFNRPYLKHQIHPGTRLIARGKLTRYNNGLQLANPLFEVIEDDAEPDALTARLRPVYPASERLTSRQVSAAVDLVLDRAAGLIEDHLDDAYRAKRELPALGAAYRMIHAPESQAQVDDARRRLAYDELLMLQLAVHLKRAHLRKALRAPALQFDSDIDQRIRSRLPFKLTEGQNKVVAEVSADLSRDVPTNRLIQGEVGSGKTVVALHAMLLAAASGHQAALMAPTELLAEQHLASISAMLEGSRVKVELLTGGATDAHRASVIARLASGDIDIIVGTHALLTDRVEFKSLAVAIIDEQHRFGVHQRAALRVKGMGSAADIMDPLADHRPLTPHVLVMTATPIPRTIGLTLFGDLDISTIHGLPPGRQPVETRVVGVDDRDEVYAMVRARIDAGEQAFVVVPAIDTGISAGDAGLNDLRSVMAELEAGAMAGVRVAAVHGRLKPATREMVMGRFREGLIDCLVATTVIEVGVDVPGATAMVVEHAERFGLAQLHQLRGRVGRGKKSSVCVLIASPTTDDARQRLEVMATTTDGFELAERDFEIRGPGDVIGSRQAGALPMKVADLTRDLDLLMLARRDAAAWVDASPALNAASDALIRRRLQKLYGSSLGLADVG